MRIRGPGAPKPDHADKKHKAAPVASRIGAPWSPPSALPVAGSRQTTDGSARK